MNIQTKAKWMGGLLSVLLLSSASVSSTEYIFRDVMGNTLAPARCDNPDNAGRSASDAYTVSRFSKKFCEVQGYGWHVAEEKSGGKLVCEECSDAANQGKTRCHLEDVVVTCKRIKPGSVGLIPGKG